MYLFENMIYNEAFETLRSYGYDLENRDPKTLMDTLFEVFTKTTTGSVQSIRAKLFTFDTDKFDSLRYYFNRTTFLRERVNNAGIGVTDKTI